MMADDGGDRIEKLVIGVSEGLLHLGNRFLNRGGDLLSRWIAIVS